MMQLLHKLVQLRRQREDTAEKAVVDAQQARDVAIQSRKLAESQLTECQDQRRIAEPELWKTVIGHDVKVAGMDELRKKLRGWEEREISFQTDLAKAAKEQQACELSLENARKVYAQAFRKRETMEEHLSDLEAQKQAEDDYREELEIEELAARKNPAF